MESSPQFNLMQHVDLKLAQEDIDPQIKKEMVTVLHEDGDFRLIIDKSAMKKKAGQNIQEEYEE